MRLCDGLNRAAGAETSAEGDGIRPQMRGRWEGAVSGFRRVGSAMVISGPPVFSQEHPDPGWSPCLDIPWDQQARWQAIGNLPVPVGGLQPKKPRLAAHHAKSSGFANHGP